MSPRYLVPMLVAGLAVTLTPATLPAQEYAITNATVHTLGPLGTVKNATVVLRDGIITAVGKDAEIPRGAEVIDADGKVVTPGIFDPYSHLGVVEVSLVEQTVDVQQSGSIYTAAFDVTDAINPRSTLIPINRIEGVTRAMVAPAPGDDGSNLIGRGAIIHLGSSHDYLHRGQAAMFAIYGETGAALSGGSRALAAMRLREALQDASDYRDHREEFDRRERRNYSLSRADLEALQPVLNGDIRLVVTAERAVDIEFCLRLADEFELDLAIAGGSEAWMVAEALAEASVPVILEPLRNLPGSFETLNATLENAARLAAEGVTIAFAQGDTHNSRNLSQLAGNAVANGLPYETALRAIMSNPAKIYGVQDDVGSLEPGKEADVVIWDGDPLEVTTFADQVFIRGVKIPMTSRQTLMRDRYLDLDSELPPQYAPH